MGQNVSIESDLQDLNHLIQEIEQNNVEDKLIKILETIFIKMKKNEVLTVGQFNKNKINWKYLVDLLCHNIQKEQLRKIILSILGVLFKYDRSIDHVRFGKKNQKQTGKNIDMSALTNQNQGSKKEKDFLQEIIRQLKAIITGSFNPDIQHLAMQCILELSKFDEKIKMILVDTLIFQHIAIIIRDTQSSQNNYSEDILKLSLQTALQFSQSEDENILDNVKNQRIILPMIQLINSKQPKQVVELSCNTLASLAQNHAIKQYFIQQNTMADVFKLFQKTSNKDIQFQISKLFASLSDSTSLLMFRSEEVIDQIISFVSNYRQHELGYSYIICLLILSQDEVVYSLLKKREFFSIFLKNITFLQIKDKQKLRQIIQSILNMCRLSINFNQNDEYFMLCEPLFELFQNTEEVKLKNQLLESLSFLTLKYDIQVHLAQAKFINQFILYIQELMEKKPVSELAYVENEKQYKQQIDELQNDKLPFDKENFLYILTKSEKENQSELLHKLDCEIIEKKEFYQLIFFLVRNIGNIFMNAQNFFLNYNKSFNITVIKLKNWVEQQSRLHRLIEISAAIQQLDYEITMTLLLFKQKFNYEDDLQKIKFAMKVSDQYTQQQTIEEDFLHDEVKKFTFSLHHKIKALGILGLLALDHQKKQLMIEKGVIDHLIGNLGDEKQIIVCETARTIVNILLSPAGLILWMKFDSDLLSLDCSGKNTLITHGRPESISACYQFDQKQILKQRLRLKEHQQMYQSWGVLFEKDAYFEIPLGLNLGYDFTVSFWMYYSSNQYNNIRNLDFKNQTLFQDAHGQPHIIIQDDKIGIFDIETQEIEFFKFCLKDCLNDETFNHITLIFENVNIDRVMVFVNGQVPRNGVLQMRANSNDIKYIGNTKDGMNPFMVLIDLRIYPRILVEDEVRELSTYDHKLQFNLLLRHPDNYFELFVQMKKLKDKDLQGVEELLKALTRIKYHEALLEICRALAILATKNNCRLDIIKRKGLIKFFKLLNSEYKPLSLLAAKCLINLK